MNRKLYFTKDQALEINGRQLICHAGQYYDVENKDAETLIAHNIAFEVKDEKSIILPTGAIINDRGSKKLSKSGRDARRR